MQPVVYRIAPMMDKVMQTDFPMEVLFRLVSEGTTHSATQLIAAQFVS